MTTLREAAQQALEALDGVEALLTSMDVTHLLVYEEVNNAITALKAALTEPVQEPVAIADGTFNHDCPIGTLLYTAPPQRPAEPVQEPSKFLDVVTYTGTGVNCAALAEPETCTWQQDGDSDSGSYGTSCRRYFNLEDGTPEDNKMQWCCYCGKKLAQALITEDSDE